ncbi:MAG: NAD(P)-dependent oxidoreductase [Salinibacterium sp.]|nr:NAD(P)-dependent oxidoreductase [Salinibacterium sp.]
MARIAFLGLGTMGRGMVSNLVKAGHDVVAWNRTPGGVEAESLGARAAGSIAEAVSGAEIVMYCLADDAAVRAVVFDGDLAAAVDPNATVIDLSTVSPEASEEEQRHFAERGISFLDAPVFGSKGEAESGGLWVVAGGDRDTFDRVHAVLDAIAESVHYMGDAGSGVRMKLVGNLVVASQLLALGEALSLARRAGLDLKTVLGVLAVTDFRSPIFDGVGAAVLAADYSPSFALHLMQKDASLIQRFAGDLHTPVTGVDAAREYIDRAMESGWGNENASALIKSIAESAGADLTSP